MIPLSKVTWGPIDALADKHFSDKWIEPDDIKKCLAPNRWIISGEKGSGKSAIRRAIIDLHRDNYFVAVVVDFDKINFRPLYENLVKLAQTTSLSKMAMLSHAWQYSIVVELAKGCAEKDRRFLAKIKKSIPEARLAPKLHGRLLALLEEAWNKVDEFTGFSPSDSKKRKPAKANLLGTAGLTAVLLGELSNFPLDSKYDSLKGELFNLIRERAENVVLVLDGFDQLHHDTDVSREAIKLIFASLVDAILQFQTDLNMPETLAIKALIPHDRYIELELRDSDKIDALHWPIRWTRSSLKEFVRKRIENSTSIQASNFSSLWQQVFPEHVYNTRYKLEEDSFDHVLRHTMFRPRHIQTHLGHLAASYEGKNIDPSMVPGAVSSSAKTVANNFVNECKIDHPKLREFINLFSEKENIMEYHKLREFVQLALKRFQPGSAVTVEERVDLLYAMGFFGLVKFVDSGAQLGDRYYPPTRESNRHYVEFFYKEPHSAISGRLKDDSLVALHPIFIDLVDLKPHPKLIVG
jgi:hypothetical protein